MDITIKIEIVVTVLGHLTNGVDLILISDLNVELSHLEGR